VSKADGLAHGYQHGEAFCLMLYRCKVCGGMEILWNSRDGVTPFSIHCRNAACNEQDFCPMLHEEWRLDTCLPLFKPWPGMRIFRSGTEDEARAFMRQRLENGRGTEYEVPESRWAEIIESAATSTSGEFQPGWPMIEEVKA